MVEVTVLKNNFREKYVWLLLPILFAICFIAPYPKWATNLYRFFIVIPMLLCFRVEDLKLMWSKNSFRWLAVLFLWTTLTLLWDGWDSKDVKLLWRQLNVMALFYLVFLVARYHQHRLPAIMDWFLVFGVVGVVLILIDWQGVQHFSTAWHHKESSRGVFHHHLNVGWMMAVLSLLASHQWLKATTKQRSVLNAMAAWLFIFMTFFVQARGGYVVLFSGLALLLFLHPGKKTNFLVVAGGFVVLAFFVLFQQELLSIWAKVFSRGTSGRMPIWSNGYSAITNSASNFLFGHGASVSAENQVGGFIAAHYHNFFLNQIFYTGLLGLVLYAGLLLNLLKTALYNQSLWVLAIVLLAMQVGFIPDGDRLWVNPSAMMLCVLLPMAWIMFLEKNDTANDFSWASVFSKQHVGLLSGTLILIVIAAYWLNGSATRQNNFSEFDGGQNDVLNGTIMSVPETGVVVVNIDGWPAFFGKRMPVLINGLERPYPWRYQCDEARTLWNQGRAFVRELSRTNPRVGLQQVHKENVPHFFRLEADVYVNGENLADLLIAKGYVVRKGEAVPWCQSND